MLRTIRSDELKQRLQADTRAFAEAKPFKHIVMDDFLTKDVSESLAQAFPHEDWPSWHRNVTAQDKFQPKKLTCDRIELIPEPLDRLILELNSGPVINWLEALTGISNLVPDPYLFGGGLHSTGPGGMLKPHIDFHYGKNQRLHRRLNLLVYLNTDWSEEFNGGLELWDQEKDSIAKIVYPELGRAVLFQTDANSLHGFSTPLKTRTRNSVAMYYYTVEAPATYSGDYATHWRSDKAPAGAAQKMKTRSARFFARALGSVAWRLNSLSHRIESFAGRESK